MANISSGLGTTQTYIPAVNATQIGRFGGLMMQFPSLASLETACTAEVSNIGGQGATWSNGQVMTVPAEIVLGAYRIWDTSLQHGRTVQISPAKKVILATYSNTVLETSGLPINSTGANGDVAIDWPGNSYYTKSGGSWTFTGNLLDVGGGSVPTLLFGLSSDTVDNQPRANGFAYNDWVNFELIKSSTEASWDDTNKVLVLSEPNALYQVTVTLILDHDGANTDSFYLMGSRLNGAIQPDTSQHSWTYDPFKQTGINRPRPCFSDIFYVPTPSEGSTVPIEVYSGNYASPNTPINYNLLVAVRRV